jgi:hypothetical protein
LHAPNGCDCLRGSGQLNLRDSVSAEEAEEQFTGRTTESGCWPAAAGISTLAGSCALEFEACAAKSPC